MAPVLLKQTKDIKQWPNGKKGFKRKSLYSLVGKQLNPTFHTAVYNMRISTSAASEEKEAFNQRKTMLITKQKLRC